MSALEIIEKLDKSPCVWKEEKDIDTCYVYASGCDNPFEFVDGNPKDNNFKFCPFCGGKINDMKEVNESYEDELDRKHEEKYNELKKENKALREMITDERAEAKKELMKGGETNHEKD